MLNTLKSLCSSNSLYKFQKLKASSALNIVPQCPTVTSIGPVWNWVHLFPVLLLFLLSLSPQGTGAQGFIPLTFQANIQRVIFKLFLYLIFTAEQSCEVYFLNISQVFPFPCISATTTSVKVPFLSCLLYFSIFPTKFLNFPVFLSHIIQYILKSFVYNVSLMFCLPFNPHRLSISYLVNLFLATSPLHAMISLVPGWY